MKMLVILAAALAAIAPGLPASAQDTSQESTPVFAPTRFTVETVGEGPDIVLIPGLGSVPAVYDGQMDMLASNQRVHRITVAGFDGSAPGPNAQGPVLAPLVEELAQYIATLPGGRATIIGHSMGGFTGLNLALDHPDRVERLMIVDSLPFYSVVFDPNATAQGMEPMATAARAQMIAQPAQDPEEVDCANPSMMMRWMVIDEEALCLVMRQTASADPRVSAQLFYELATSDARPRLGEIELPVTMLYPVDPAIHDGAAMDTLYAGQYADLDGIELVRIDNSRHFIMYDQPEAFARALTAFLAD